jgi:cell division protein FtsN
LRKVSPEETWYRVTAGKFDTREEGLKTIRALKKKGLLPALKK